MAGDEMVDGEAGWTGPLPEGVTSASPPPVTALEPTVRGYPMPAGVFTLVEFVVEHLVGGTWAVRSVWQLAEGYGRDVVVDGADLVMDGEPHAVPFPQTRVRPGEFLRLSGPLVAWRPGVVEALRALERDES